MGKRRGRWNDRDAAKALEVPIGTIRPSLGEYQLAFTLLPVILPSRIVNGLPV